MSEDPQGPSLEHAAGVLVHLAVVIADRRWRCA